jgi:EAL and modified HD-GYP domain-containing signal transduction protein
MKEALQMVNVSKETTEALVDKKGDLAKVFEFISFYEIAQWSELSRQMIVYNINEAPVYDAYVDALAWYRDLFGNVEDKK